MNMPKPREWSCEQWTLHIQLSMTFSNRTSLMDCTNCTWAIFAVLAQTSSNIQELILRVTHKLQNYLTFTHFLVSNLGITSGQRRSWCVWRPGTRIVFCAPPEKLRVIQCKANKWRRNWCRRNTWLVKHWLTIWTQDPGIVGKYPYSYRGIQAQALRVQRIKTELICSLDAGEAVSAVSCCWLLSVSNYIRVSFDFPVVSSRPPSRLRVNFRPA